MNTRTHPGMWVAGLTAFCLLLGTTLSAGAYADGDSDSDSDSDNKSNSHRKALEGTWRTIEDGFDPDIGINGLPGLITFSAGANPRKSGTVVHTDPGFIAPQCLPLQGVWRRTGRRTFIGTDENFCLDFNLRTKYLIRLDRSGNTFEADYVIEIGFGDGVFFPLTAGMLHGVRMQAEAP